MTTSIGSDTIKGLSIHLLDNTKPFETSNAVEVFIQKIIKQPDNSPDDSRSTYQPTTLSQWDIQQHNQFHAKLYFAKRYITTRMSKWVTSMSGMPQSELGQVEIDFILFLYREKQKLDNATSKTTAVWELFALTTNEGWRVARRYTNYRFPMVVALRLVSPNLSATKKKHLTGGTNSSVDIYRNEFSLANNERETIWRWFKGFTSAFKSNCSLYNPKYGMSDFTCRNGIEIPIAVEVNPGKLSIKKPLTISQYTSLLVHFSRIFSGEETQGLTQTKEEVVERIDPGIRHLDNIRMIDPKMIPSLSQTLLKLVWGCFNKRVQIGGFHLSHHGDKFFHSGTFYLKYKLQVMEWNARPSLSQVLETMRYLYTPNTHTNFDAFQDSVTKTSFKFDERPTYHPITNFIHGDLRYEGNIYFRVDTLWLQVQADQLIVMHRDFFQLLQRSLYLPDETVLRLPWIAKSQWAAFTMEQMQQACNIPKEIFSPYMKTLMASEFSFVNEKGQVTNALPNRSLLIEVEGDKRLLNKRWENILEVLGKKEPVTQPLLEAVLKSKDKKKNKQTPKRAEQLLKALQKKRPIITQLENGEISKEVAVLDEKQIPLFPDMDAFPELCSAAKTHKIAINRLLQAKYKSKEAVTFKDIQNLKTNHRKITKGSDNTLWDALQKKRNIKTALHSETDFLLMQGPVPEITTTENLQQLQTMKAYLEGRLQDMQRFGPEEHYNRQYLDQPGYLVGDQISPTPGEKIELFDILHHGVTKRLETPTIPLSLVHVKEGFGQSTREACAQIRISASTIHNAMNSKNAEILRGFYQAIIKDTSSPFRRKLKQVAERDFSEESFVKLFQDKWAARQIHFVYAFIDEEENERWLFRERNCAVKFTADDFISFTKAKTLEATNELFNLLKSEKILNDEGQLESTVLRMTQPEFAELLPNHKKQAPQIFQFLLNRCSQFASLGAKVELLELAMFLENRGFGFKICQIPRTSHGHAKSTSSISGWRDVSREDWITTPIKTLSPAFQYGENSYSLKGEMLDDQGVLALLLRVDTQSVGLAFYKLLETAKMESYGEKSPIDMIQAKFTRSDWEFAASKTGTRIIIFTKDDNNKIETANPTVVHEAGTKLIYLVSSSAGYQSAAQILSDDDDNDLDSSPTTTSLSFSTTLSITDQDLLLSDTNRIGMRNRGNDCFFNALFQLILNSQLVSSFLSAPSNLMKENGTIVPKSQTFFDFWRELILQYHHSARAGQPLNYNRSQMRHLLGYTEDQFNAQQDAPEAFRRILDYYKNLILLHATQEDEVILSQKNEIPQGKDLTEADENGRIPLPNGDVATALNIILKETDTEDFDRLIQASLEVEEKIKEARRFSHAKKSYSVPNFTQKTRYECVANEVFLVASRWRATTRMVDKGDGKGPMPEMIRSDKIHSKLGMKPIHVIGTQRFALQGFVTHISHLDSKGRPSTTLKAGHYVAFCKTDQGWFKFNDDASPEKYADERAIEEANHALLLHFKKEEESKNESASTK